MDSLVIALKVVAQGILLLIGGNSLLGAFISILSISENMGTDCWQNFNHFVSELEPEVLEKIKENGGMDNLREEFELCKGNTVTNNRCVITSGIIATLVLGGISFLCLCGLIAI